MTTSDLQPIPVLAGARDLLPRYDVIFCDVWGVVHNGVTAYVPAGEALARFRAGGGRVVLLSNAPTPSPIVAKLLDAKGVRRDAWDALVTSGDITRAHLSEKRYARVHHIGEPRDMPIFKGLDVTRTDLAAAEAVVCTGLVDEVNETGETYRPLMIEARRLGLPFVCANPDLVVEVGGVLLPCAGAVAAVYEELGGDVFWAGKPHLSAYEMAYATATQVTGRAPERHRILAIGDAVRTDIAGARSFGIDSLLIAGGIHREALMPSGAVDHDELARITAPPAPRPNAAMTELVW